MLVISNAMDTIANLCLNSEMANGLMGYLQHFEGALLDLDEAGNGRSDLLAKNAFLNNIEDEGYIMIITMYKSNRSWDFTETVNQVGEISVDIVKQQKWGRHCCSLNYIQHDDSDSKQGGRS